MKRDLRCYLTNSGLQAENDAIRLGKTLKITHVTLDADLLPDDADPREVVAVTNPCIDPIVARVTQDKNKASILHVTFDLGIEVGGFNINGVAIIADFDGTEIVYGYARGKGDYKQTKDEGAVESVRYDIQVITSNAAALEIKVSANTLYPTIDDFKDEQEKNKKIHEGTTKKLSEVDSALQRFENVHATTGTQMTAIRAKIDELKAGLKMKDPVSAVATDHIDKTGLPVVNGVQLHAGDRVLLTAQNDSADNLIFVAGAQQWTLANDIDDNPYKEAINGMAVMVSGYDHELAQTIWQAMPITNGWAWHRRNDLASMVEGDGITITDKKIAVEKSVLTTLEFFRDNFNVAAPVKYITAKNIDTSLDLISLGVTNYKHPSVVAARLKSKNAAIESAAAAATVLEKQSLADGLGLDDSAEAAATKAATDEQTYQDSLVAVTTATSEKAAADTAKTDADAAKAAAKGDLDTAKAAQASAQTALDADSANQSLIDALAQAKSATAAAQAIFDTKSNEATAAATAATDAATALTTKESERDAAKVAAQDSLAKTTKGSFDAFKAVLDAQRVAQAKAKAAEDAVAEEGLAVDAIAAKALGINKLKDNDRVAVIAQDDTTENGFYVVAKGHLVKTLDSIKDGMTFGYIHPVTGAKKTHVFSISDSGLIGAKEIEGKASLGGGGDVDPNLESGVDFLAKAMNVLLPVRHIYAAQTTIDSTVAGNYKKGDRVIFGGQDTADENGVYEHDGKDLVKTAEAVNTGMIVNVSPASGGSTDWKLTVDDSTKKITTTAVASLSNAASNLRVVATEVIALAESKKPENHNVVFIVG